MSQGILIVLSGPSGVGKSSILRRLLDGEHGIAMSVSCTTRPPRPGERDGNEYFFLSQDDFLQRVHAGAMAEHAVVFGHHYGTPRDFLEQKLASGIDVVTDIDVQGARQIKLSMPGAVMIFIVAPTRPELESRLRLRHTEDDASLALRLDTAAAEMAEIDLYDYVVVNGVLDSAVRTVSAIRRAEHARRTRSREDFSW
ncbi:MAG: guanylate kinase [Planctomycetes bacterium]|nr:guanylate kinase [Planctomycetota bacterium]